MKKIFNYTFITYIQNNEIYYFIVRYSIVEFDKLNFQLMMMISPSKRLDLCPAIHSKNHINQSTKNCMPTEAVQNRT